MKKNKKLVVRERQVKTKKGFSLIEVLASMVVVSLGITAVTMLMTSSIKASVQAKNQVIAAGLAQEGIELARNLRDNDPTAFAAVSDGAEYRVDYNVTDIASMGASNPNSDKRLYLDVNGYSSHTWSASPMKFYRKISISTSGANQQITSFVSWSAVDVSGSFADCKIGKSCLSTISVLPTP